MRLVSLAALCCLLWPAAARSEPPPSASTLISRWCEAEGEARAPLEQAIRARGAKAVSALDEAAVREGVSAADRTRLARIARELREAYHRAHVPDGMVYVPAGRLELPRARRMPGPSGAKADVGAFYIDVREVTVGAWRAWLETCAAAAPRGRLRRARHTPPADLDDALPVTRITWDEATEFAAARGGRLPTDREFARALRGSGIASWPWGDAGLAGRANLRGYGPDRLMPVGSYPKGKSPFGVLDLVGNAAEWSATTKQGGRSPLSRRPLVLGGSFRDGADPALAWHDARSRGDSTARRPWVGFRVVRDVPDLPGPDDGVSSESGAKR